MVRQLQQDRCGRLGCGDVVLQRHFIAEAFRDLRLRAHRRLVDPVRVGARLFAHLLPEQRTQIARVRLREIADRMDPAAVQPLRGLFPHEEQVPHRKRPHLFFHLFREQCMHAVRLLEIARHLRTEFVPGDADIDRESQFITDLILDLICQRDRIRIDLRRSGQIQKALVDGELLHRGCVFSADIFKRLRALRIQPEIRLHEHQLRALLQSHRHGLAGRDSELFRRDRLRDDDAAPRLRVSAHGGRNEAQILLAAAHAPDRLPGQKGAVHVDVKNEALLCHAVSSARICRARPPCALARYFLRFVFR